MRFWYLALAAAVGASAYAEVTKPLFSGKELADGLDIITEGLGDTTDMMSSLILGSDKGVAPLVDQMQAAQRAASIASNALPALLVDKSTTKESQAQPFPRVEQRPICKALGRLFPAIRDLGEEIQRTAARDNKPDPKWLPVGREVEPLMSALIELCLQSVQVAPKCYNVNIRALSESTKHLLPHQGARFEHILKAQEGNHTEES